MDTVWNTNEDVIEVSIIQLVKDLCLCLFEGSKPCLSSNPLINTFQKPTKQVVFGTCSRDNTDVVNSLVRLFYDSVLLRRWQWYGSANKGSSIAPGCRCMSFCHHLSSQGKHDDAGHLIEAVTSLTGGTSGLREPEAILLFLSLLADVKVDTQALPLPLAQPMKNSEFFRYEMYSSSFFEKPPQLSDLVGLSDELSQNVSLFECTPGTGFDSFLTQPPGIEGKTGSLYDGLVHTTVGGLNTPLGLPRLPTDQQDLTLMPHTEPVDLLSASESLSVPTDNQTSTSFSTCLASETSTVDLFFSSNDVITSTIREWEGWKIGTRQYLCDNSGTCFPHALELCLSGHCSLAEVDQCEVEGVGSLASGVIKSLDTLPLATVSVFEEGGSVSWMLGKTIQSLLDHYRAQLHQLAESSSELKLSLSSHWILPTVRFLMEIWNDVEHLPKGLALLDVLYVQACQVQGTPYYLLLLNLLAKSLAPYFKFVEQWVFQGWLDLGEEFGLRASVEALGRRDEEYWSRGYTLSGEGGCAPGFLSSQAHTILTCGKALNLLRICKPSHPLCTGMFRPPKLQVQLSRRGLEQCSEQCQQYGREVQENEQIRHELLQQGLMAKEDELRAEVLKARQEARAHVEKLKKLEEAYQAEQKQKKIDFRTELLEQIRTNQVLHSEQEAEERQQDKERLDYLTSKEGLQTKHEAALQEKARKEMISYYAGLSREAELRRLRAEWRAKRYELSTQRFEFLRRERELLSVESNAKASKQTTPLSVRRPSQPQLGESSLPTAPLSLDESQTGESMVGTEPPVSRTGGEDSGQGVQGTMELPSRRTWIASMIDQPVQIEVMESPQATEECHKLETDLQALDIIQMGDHGEELLAPAEAIFTPLPTPPMVADSAHMQRRSPSPQDLNHRHKTTDDPVSLSHPLEGDIRLPRTQSSSQQQKSAVQELLHPTEHAQKEVTISSRGCKDPSTAQEIIYGTQKLTENHVNTRGAEPESTVQDIIYSTGWAGDASGPLIQDPGHPRLVSTRGHAPQSTIQHKLYPLRYIEQPKKKEPATESQVNRPQMEFSPYMKYRDDFSMLGAPPTLDMLDTVLGPPSQDNIPEDIDPDFLSVYPVSTLIEQSLALPILAQSTLVNEALLRYFLTECRIIHHFTVLKWFLLLEDGEFGHALSTRLCEELAYGRNWRVLCSASFLNPILTAALEVSVHSRCPKAQRVSFALKYRPTAINTQAIDALEFLQLKYQVDWPCNIVITNSAIEKYNDILQLLLQMKRASWALKNTFHQLKDCRGLSAAMSRQLQVYRHEYQHFVNVMHGYIANQVFQITWREFEMDLQNEVHSFEELIQAHHNFIKKAIFRCLLSKKAQPVMKLIQNIFGSILKFSNQLTGEQINVRRSYTAMCETHTRFREVSDLLIKVVNKLVQRGYQPHLEDFLLRLDFNEFYKQ